MNPYLRLLARPFQYYFPYSFKHSKEFYQWLDFVNTSQWDTPEAIAAYQWTQVKKMLDHCYANVPYYSALFKRLNAHPDDFRSLADYEQFPLLTRQHVREHSQDMIATNIDPAVINTYNTGGSTGIPLKIFGIKSDNTIEQAFIANQWARVNFKPKDRVILLRGDVVPDGKLWQYRPSSNSWIFSSYHLSPVFIADMVKKINKIKPKYLHVYPSSLWVFANLMKEQDLHFNFKLTAVLCGSEKLFDFQRDFVESYYGTKCYSWLGLGEQTILAGECEHSKNLHAFPQYSYNELIDQDERIIRKPHISGEIVGTTLHKYVFPLMRYKSGDLASYAEGPCKCGRNFPLLEDVQGRIQNMIVGSDNRLFPLTAVFFGQHLEAFNKVHKIQLEQSKAGIVSIKIVKGNNFDQQDEAKFKMQLLTSTDHKIDFSIHYCDDIERTNQGKHKFLIQHLDVESFKFNQED